MGYEYVTLAVASRLIGLDPSVVSKHASRGRYGPTRKRDGEVYVSTRGLEMASCRAICPSQVAAAKAHKPLPMMDWDAFDRKKLVNYSPEQIGSEVVRTKHMTEEVLINEK